MKDPFLTTRITQWGNRVVAGLLAGFVFFLPAVLNWYCSFRTLTDTEWWAIAIAFYVCVLVIAPALWNMDRLLSNILKGQVFTTQNVTRLRRIRWCCGGVSLICLPAACIYLPLFFIVIIMAFLCLALSVMVQVMKAAVLIREENDLTI